MVKHLPAYGRSLGQEDPLEKGVLVEAACPFLSTPTLIQPARDWASVSKGRSWLSTVMDVHGRLSRNTISSRCGSFCHVAAYICSFSGLNVLYWHLPPQTLSTLMSWGGQSRSRVRDNSFPSIWSRVLLLASHVADIPTHLEAGPPKTRQIASHK